MYLLAKMIESGEDTLVKDGTLDIHGNPADKKKTGNWKACYFILGKALGIHTDQKITCTYHFAILETIHYCVAKLDIVKLYCKFVTLSGNECCERLAYYGMSTNLVNYFIQRLHQGNATAAENVSNWSGTCYVMPLLGAFLADAYLGRYRVIAIFSIIYVIVSLL